MNDIARRTAYAGALTLILAATAWAQAPSRVRGTIEKIDGQNLSIKSRTGETIAVKLAANAPVSAVVPAKLTDIKVGTFVGIAALSDGKGGWRALEVLIFPEAMRGTGEGDRPWDLMPESTMTNATVSESVAKVQGHTLTLKFKEGDKTFTVPSEAPIVTFAAADKGELKPGAKVFIAAASKQPDGSQEAARIAVGRGIEPPM